MYSNESGLPSSDSQPSWLDLESTIRNKRHLYESYSDPRSITWFLQLKEWVRRIVDRYCSMIQRAMHILENKRSAFRHYMALKLLLEKTQERWLEFAERNTITPSFLSKSIIYDNFYHAVYWMETPGEAPRAAANEMVRLRKLVQLTAREIHLTSGLVEESFARITEMQQRAAGELRVN